MRTECVVDPAPTPGARRPGPLPPGAAPRRSRRRRRRRRGAQPVAELEVDGELWVAWDEAVEHDDRRRRVRARRRGDAGRGPGRRRRRDAVRPSDGSGRSVVERRPVDRRGRPSSEPQRRARTAAPGARSPSRTPPTWPSAGVDRDEVAAPLARRASTRCSPSTTARSSRCSTRPRRRAAVAGCDNDGTFPVLVGDGDDRRRAVVADHPLRPPGGGAREPGRHLRRDRDRRDPRAAGADADRRREGRGPRHRPRARPRSSTGCDDMPPEVWERLHGDDPLGRGPVGRADAPGSTSRCRGGTRRSTPRSTRGPTRIVIGGVEVGEGHRGPAAPAPRAPTPRTCSSPARRDGRGRLPRRRRRRARRRHLDDDPRHRALAVAAAATCTSIPTRSSSCRGRPP